MYQEITLSKAYFSESTLSPHLTPPPPPKKEATNSRDIYAVGIEENYNFAGIQLHLSQMYSDTKTFTDETFVLLCNRSLSCLCFDRCFILDLICQQGVKRSVQLSLITVAYHGCLARRCCSSTRQSG